MFNIKIALTQFFLFVIVIIFYSQQFLLAAINYLPMAFFLLLMFSCKYYQTKQIALLLGSIGILLTFIGSYIQIYQISLHPNYFNHNALYHVIQFIALYLLFNTSKWIIAKK